MPLYHISYATPDGHRTDESELKRDLGEVIEVIGSLMDKTRESVSVWEDKHDRIEEDVYGQVENWTSGGWGGPAELEMLDGSRVLVKQVEHAEAEPEPEIQAPDSYTGFEQFDSILAQALSDIAWVRDDLASWESESAHYDADKLRGALRIIVARLDRSTKGS